MRNRESKFGKKINRISGKLRSNKGSFSSANKHRSSNSKFIQKRKGSKNLSGNTQSMQPTDESDGKAPLFMLENEDDQQLISASDKDNDSSFYSLKEVHSPETLEHKEKKSSILRSVNPPTNAVSFNKDSNKTDNSVNDKRAHAIISQFDKKYGANKFDNKDFITESQAENVKIYESKKKDKEQIVSSFADSEDYSEEGEI